MKFPNTHTCLFIFYKKIETKDVIVRNFGLPFFQNHLDTVILSVDIYICNYCKKIMSIPKQLPERALSIEDD